MSATAGPALCHERDRQLACLADDSVGDKAVVQVVERCRPCAASGGPLGLLLLESPLSIANFGRERSGPSEARRSSASGALTG
jgi:hypothetical protein